MKITDRAHKAGYKFCDTLTGDKVHIFKDQANRTAFYLYAMCSNKRVVQGIVNQTGQEYKHDGMVCERCYAKAVKLGIIAKGE